MTYNQLYKYAVDTLKKANIQPCVFDAGQIFEFIFGFDRYKLVLKGEQAPTEQLQQSFLQMVNRRASHEPLQYLLGEWEFYSLPFKVGKGVLIPRADTEVLVDTALRIIKNKQNPIIVDLCSGSGCIAVAIAKNNTQSKVYAAEKSDKAFEYLAENIRLNAAYNVTAVKADVLLPNFETEPLDLIVSNPPYIPNFELNSLQQEVKHEPSMALDGGSDGLIFYRENTRMYKNRLKADGYIVFEVGYNQAQAVKQILAENGYVNINTAKDINGIERVVYGCAKALN